MKLRHLTPLILSLFLLVTAPALWAIDEVKPVDAKRTDKVQLAIESLKKEGEAATLVKDWDKAIKIWSRLLAIQPDHIAALLGRADAHCELGQHALGLADDRKAVELSPNHVKAWNLLCWHSIAAGEWGQARTACERNHALAPNIMATNVNLGHTYFLQGDLATAQRWYDKTLPLLENEDDLVAGPVADFDLFIQRGWQVEAAKQARIWFAEQGGQWLKGIRLHQQVLSLLQQGNYAEALPLAQQVLAIREKVLGPEHTDVATSLNNLAELYRRQGHYTQAAPLYRRALSIWENSHRTENLDVAETLNNLAALYSDQGLYAQVEPLLKRTLEIQVKVLGPDHLDVAGSLNNLAELYRDQGQYGLTELLLKRALEIREKALGPEHPDVATIINNLAGLYETQGYYAQAEQLFKRALAILEKVRGLEHPNIASCLNNLAALYRVQGEYAQAELLFKRSLAIREKTYGPDHPQIAQSLHNLAALYKAQGQYELAELSYRRALGIVEKSLGPDHPNVANVLNNLAGLYDAQGQYALAESLNKRALTIWEKTLGPEHPSVATSLNNLAALYNDQAQYAEAEPLYLRALTIWEKAFGPEHPNVATSLNNLAKLYSDQTLYAKALALSRRSTTIYRQRILAGGSADTAIREALQNRKGFHLHLEALSRNPEQEPVSNITDEAFQVVQLKQASGTASAIAKMAARFAKGEDAMAGLVKRKQDASDDRSKAETQLVSAASKTPAERNAAYEQKLREDITRANSEIETIDAELSRHFPEYQELTRPEPVSVREIRALLKPGEAMLVYALGDKSFLWVVKPDGAEFSLLKVGTKDVSSKVSTVRTEMEFDAEGKAPRVSVQVLHDLYQGLIAPAIPHLSGVRHIMVVAEGPLQSLPFGMLVASQVPDIRSDEDYRQVDWLAKHFALSVLPSVSSIRAFRQFAKSPGIQEPFAGFGDPLIGDGGSSTRGKRAKMDVAKVFRNLAVGTDRQSNASMEIADVEAIRQAPRLPETADELRAMGKAVKSDLKALWLQKNASETQVKNLDLSKYRTIAFATHGVLAGEVKGAGEPGLILTPPLQGSPENDGYLSAGEVAKLNLNADWVVLSACNTASSDGTPGAEGLSGLTKAFFYAGARSLLVSHWPVASEATVHLTTGMLKEYQANPAQGKAEALRKAMLSLMATLTHPEYAHPLFWAPFVVVGEGGWQQ